MITGSAVLDMSRDSQSGDRRAIGSLYAAQSGSRVVLNVGNREFAPPDAIRLLQEYTDLLHVDVHGSPGAVQAWVSALRGQESIGWGWPA